MKIDEGLKKKIKKKIFEQLASSKKNKVIIITPIPLTNHQKDLILTHFSEYKHLPVENIIDKKLLGGFILKIGDTIIDASIQGRINNLINQLYGFN
jgi:F-type H+-transporting ATPase subunit delta